jgi:hypothetical protein
MRLTFERFLSWGTHLDHVKDISSYSPSKTVLLMVVGLLWAACKRREKAITPTWEAQRRAFPQQEARGLRLEWREGTGGLGHLRADTLFRRLRGDTVVWQLIGHIVVEWTRADSASRSRLTCEEAELDLRQGLLKAYRQVTLETNTGERLQTDELWWDRSQRRLFAPGWVRIQTPKEEVRGLGLESADELRTYKLRRIQGRLERSPV